MQSKSGSGARRRGRKATGVKLIPRGIQGTITMRAARAGNEGAPLRFTAHNSHAFLKEVLMSGHMHALVAVRDARGRNALLSTLESRGLVPVCASTLGEARSILSHERVAVIFCQSRLEDGGFEDVLAEKSMRSPGVPVVVCSPSPDSESYLDVMSRGAFDFIAFPYARKEIEWILTCALPGPSARAANVA